MSTRPAPGKAKAALLFLLTGTWGALLFAAISVPPVVDLETAGAGSALGFDKALHFAGFFVLGLLLVMALRLARPVGSRLRAIVLALLATIAYGLALEAGQVLVTSRVADPLDALFNILGAIVGVSLGEAVIEWRLRAGRPMQIPGGR